MGPVERQLERLDSEIIELTAKEDAAWNAFLSATDPQQKAVLEKRCENLAEDRKDRLSQRHDMQLKLSSLAVRDPSKEYYADRVRRLGAGQDVGSVWHDVQDDPNYPTKNYLFNMHRPADAQGLPAALVSPIFGEFLDTFNGDGHPDSALCKLILRLTTMLSASYKSTDTAGCRKISQRMLGKDYQGRSRGGEQQYSIDLTNLLAELLHSQLGGSHSIIPAPVSRDSKEMTDESIVVRDENDRVLAHVLIMEAKHEWGAGGCSDSQVQALANYARTAVRGWNRTGVCDTVLPALLLEASSNSLRLSAAYFTDKICCEPLTPHLHFSDLRDGQPQYMEQLGRFLHAFATTIKQLEGYYGAFKGLDAPSREPSEEQLQAVHSRNLQDFNIPYMQRGPDRGYKRVEPVRGGHYTYLCTKPSGEQTVCKVTLTPYPEQLHRELAAGEKKWAPAFFRQTQHPGGVHVSEMEYLSGSQGWTQLSRYTGDRQALKPMAKEALRGLQQCLGNTAVHGDLRPPNIMIRLEGDAVKELRFIDLASAGRDGEARYPLFLNRQIAWPCESPDGQPIFQKHDEKLLFDSLSLGRQVTSDRGKQQMPIRAGMAQMRFQSHRRPRIWLQLRPKQIVRAAVML